MSAPFQVQKAGVVKRSFADQIDWTRRQGRPKARHLQGRRPINRAPAAKSRADSDSPRPTTDLNDFRLEAMEPRMLLSADLLPFAVAMDADGDDYTLQFNDNLSQFEILDNTDGALVDFQALDETSEITIQGSAADDRLVMDLAVTYILPGGISFTGGDGIDTLVGPGVDATWYITGADAGTVMGLDFSDLEILEGAADNQDTMVIEQGGSVSGHLEGGDGGYDVVEVLGTYATQVYAPTGPDSGSISLDGVTTEYQGFEPVGFNPPALDTATDVTFDLSAIIGGTYILEQDPGAKDFRFRDVNDAIEVHEFDDLTALGTLTIDLGTGAEMVTLFDLDGFNADIIINGGDGNDVFVFEDLDAMGGSSDITVNGGDDDDTYQVKDGWAAGDLVINEVFGEGDDTLNFTGFTGDPLTIDPSGVDELTISSPSEGTTILLDLDTPDNLENITGADVVLTTDQLAEMADGFDDLIAFADNLMVHEQFDAVLPILRDDSGGDVTLGKLAGLLEMLDEVRHELAQFIFDGVDLDTGSLISQLDAKFAGFVSPLTYLGAAILSPLGLDGVDPVTPGDTYSFKISTSNGALSLFFNELIEVTATGMDLDSLVADITLELNNAEIAGEVSVGHRDGRLYFQAVSDDVSELHVSGTDVADNRAISQFGFPNEIALNLDKLSLTGVQNFLRSTGDLTVEAIGGAGVTISSLPVHPRWSWIWTWKELGPVNLVFSWGKKVTATASSLPINPPLMRFHW